MSVAHGLCNIGILASHAAKNSSATQDLFSQAKQYEPFKRANSMPYCSEVDIESNVTSNVSSVTNSTIHSASSSNATSLTNSGCGEARGSMQLDHTRRVDKLEQFGRRKLHTASNLKARTAKASRPVGASGVMSAGGLSQGVSHTTGRAVHILLCSPTTTTKVQQLQKLQQQIDARHTHHKRQ